MYQVLRYHILGRNKLNFNEKILTKEYKNDLSFSIDECLSEAAVEELARSTGFKKRSGKIPASAFLNTLMASENEQAHTSLPDLAAGLRQGFNIDVSKEAMHQKFTPEAVSFLENVMTEILNKQLNINADKDLKAHFPCIKVKDSTKFSLPDTYNDVYKGYGNFCKKNGLMSLQYEFDLVSGNWLSLKITPGLRNDQRDSKETLKDITPGDLYIRDLGYITPIYLSAIVKDKAFFLNRLPAMASVFTQSSKPLDWKRIDRQIRRLKGGILDLQVEVYEKDKIPCRLLIEPVDSIEYKKRLQKAEATAKSKGIGISELQKIKLRYNSFITNVSEDILPVSIVRKTYYLRWQIELVFKIWKSYFRINMVKKVKRERLECQLLARLLWILINWRLFIILNNHVRSRNPQEGVSMLVFFKRSLKFASTLRLVLLKKFSIKKWVKEILIPLIEDCLCEAPRKKKTYYDSISINNKA